MDTWFIFKNSVTIVFKEVFPFPPTLCVTLRQKFFVVLPLKSEIPPKILFQLNCEIKMSFNAGKKKSLKTHLRK